MSTRRSAQSSQSTKLVNLRHARGKRVRVSQRVLGRTPRLVLGLWGLHCVLLRVALRTMAMSLRLIADRNKLGDWILLTYVVY